MALLNKQEIDFTGVALSFTSADGTNGDTFRNDGRSVLMVNNGATAVDVTIKAQRDEFDAGSGFGNITIADTVVTVDANTISAIGPLPHTRFNDDASLVNVSYDDDSNVSVAVIDVPNI